MNVQLKDITVTARDGRVSHLDQVYIRGSHVRFFIVPDMLKYGPTLRSSRRENDRQHLLTNFTNQKRAHVPESKRPRPWCRSGQRTRNG